MAMDRGVLSPRARIKIRLTRLRPPHEVETELFGENGWRPGNAWICETTLGRVLFNELLPLGYAFVNKQMHKKEQAKIINDLAERYPMICLLYTSDAADDLTRVDLGGQEVQTGDHVQTRRGKWLARGRRQDVVARQHQHAGLGLSLGTQR